MSNVQEVETHMRSLDDHALLRVIAVEHSEYRPEALEIARAELRRRGRDPISSAEYLNKFPSERIGADGFCASCRDQTTDETPGNTRTVNFIGTRLIGHDDRCSVCGAVVQTCWFCLLLPL